MVEVCYSILYPNLAALQIVNEMQTMDIVQQHANAIKENLLLACLPVGDSCMLGSVVDIHIWF